MGTISGTRLFVKAHRDQTSTSMICILEAACLSLQQTIMKIQCNNNNNDNDDKNYYSNCNNYNNYNNYSNYNNSKKFIIMKMHIKMFHCK